MTLSRQEGQEQEAARFISDYPDLAAEVARQVAEKQKAWRVGGLTEKQLELLIFLRTYIGENGISPSFDEMKDALHLASKSGIKRLVQVLKERGFIEDHYNRARSITLVSRQ